MPEQRCELHSRTFHNICFECFMARRLTEVTGELVEPAEIESVRYTTHPRVWPNFIDNPE